MRRALVLILFVMLAAVSISCGDIEIANDSSGGTGDFDLESPEGCRLMIDELGIAYTIDEYVERARQSDPVAVYLFLTSGMSIDAKDKDGVTAMEAAKQAGHQSVIDLIEGARLEAAQKKKEKDKKTEE
jgi:hypothetical protein